MTTRRPLPRRRVYEFTVVSVTDGDTARGLLTLPPVVVSAGPLVVDVDDTFEDLVEVVHTYRRRSRDPRGEPVRALHVNTPEYRTDPAAARRAHDDSRAWLAEHAGRLMVETHGRDELSRYLGDVYVAGDRANTWSDHLMRVKGWPPFLD